MWLEIGLVQESSCSSWSMTHQAQGADQVYCTISPPTEGALNPFRELLAVSTIIASVRGLVGLLFAMVCRHYSWVGLLMVAFPQHSLLDKHESWSQGGRRLPGQIIQALCPKPCCLQQQVLTFKFWKATNGSCNRVYCFGNIFHSAGQLEERFHMPGTEVSVSLYFGGYHHHPMYIYVCVIYNYGIHVIVVFINIKQHVSSWFLQTALVLFLSPSLSPILSTLSS